MTEIDRSEEFTRDWDWYASDKEGQIGHFTSAGLRALPQSVKQDRETAERLTQYFFNEATNLCGHSICPATEADAGGLRQAARERFLKSFVEMACKGVFSYNTEMVHSCKAKYYLVAIPERPLRVSDLPPHIKEIVLRVRAPLSFAGTDYIPEADTLDW